MRLSVKTTYGIRALCDLAFYYHQGPISVKAIAARAGISAPCLEQWLNQLRRHGIVKSVRGAKGGYLLARRPEMIRLDEVVRALEGERGIVLRAGKNTSPKAHVVDQLMDRLVWKPLEQAMLKVLSASTLKDLANAARRAAKRSTVDHPYVFHI